MQPEPTDSHGKATSILQTDTPGALSVVTHLPAKPGCAASTLRTQAFGVAPGLMDPSG